MLNALTHVSQIYTIDYPLYNIITEEAQAYFSGDKTAEETARIIQSCFSGKIDFSKIR
jgi:hypothetical protein